MTRHSVSGTRRVVIIGGGFSGLGVAIELLRRGVRDLVILEKAEQLGGTWRENTYPGCACDVPSHLYSFSYAPNHDWSRVFSGQAEIQRYLLDVANAHGVLPYVRFGAEVESARWDDEDQRWTVRTSAGTVRAQVLVSGAGPLHEPRVPDIEGLDRFEGTTFHTARWRHDHDLRGRKVAVVGTGSSAIQLVPEIQPDVEALTLFQRTAPWVLPKPDHAYPPAEKALMKHVPGFQRAYRGAIYGALELLQLAERRPAVMAQVQRIGTLHLRRQVADPRLRETLTPEFTLGCKRLLLSNTYYPALTQPNVEVVDGGLARITERGVVGADGVEREADTLVFGTGFVVTDPPIAERIVGADGATLSSRWGGTPRAYLGTTVAGFPNLYLMIGPNLGNGHSSAFVLIEAQAEYIADALRAMDERGLTSVEVRRGVQDDYNEKVQEALSGTVWNAGGCASYYIDRNGINSSIYPWTTIDLRRRLRRFDAARYVLRAPPATESRRRRRPAPIDLRGAVVAITGGGHGIGAQTARRFADAGAVVCVGDLDEAAAHRTADRVGGHGYPLDVSDRASFEAFVDAVERDVGPIDVLVNNAGVMPTGRFLEEPDAVDTAAMSVNHFGTALGMKLVLPKMIGRTRGHVVNVASMAGRLHAPGLATYVASKHATVGLTRTVRDEIDGAGVTLSLVLPGPVKTRLSEGIPLEGIGAVEPSVIAQAIVDSCATRREEIVVPGRFAVLPLANAIAPSSVIRLVRRALKTDRALTSGDPSVRGGYEEAIRAQGRRVRAARATDALEVTTP